MKLNVKEYFKTIICNFIKYFSAMIIKNYASNFKNTFLIILAEAHLDNQVDNLKVLKIFLIIEEGPFDSS